MSHKIDRKLWIVARDGDEALVSQCLEQGGYKVDWRDLNDWTALHAAASSGHTPVVTRLLDSGWSLEARTEFGFTPLYLAVLNGHLETVKCLQCLQLSPRGAKREHDIMLYSAAAYGVEAVVSQVIEKGSYTVDWSGENDWTALHLAAWSGHTPVVTRLLDAGWSLEARDDAGVTPLTYAAWDGHLETVKCLLSHGAQINTQSDFNSTPLHLASSEGHTDIIKLLLWKGANFGLKNDMGLTPIDCIAPDIMEEVLDSCLRKGYVDSSMDKEFEIFFEYVILNMPHMREEGKESKPLQDTNEGWRLTPPTPSSCLRHRICCICPRSRSIVTS